MSVRVSPARASEGGVEGGVGGGGRLCSTDRVDMGGRVGQVNTELTTRATRLIAVGDLPALGSLMAEAQAAFDLLGG